MLLRAVPMAVMLLYASSALAADALASTMLAHIRDTALQSDYAENELFILTDQIGPRLDGSPQAQTAAVQVASALRRLGLNVGLIPTTVPHWVRGSASAELVNYPGEADGIAQRVVVAALGNSSATPPDGLTAPVLVVHDYDELRAQPDVVRGRIVVFDTPFDQTLADNGYAATAYARAVEYRLHGPARAAQLGAVAALVRSTGGAGYRLAHTGMTVWPQGVAPIPAADISAEDATLIAALAAKGPVRMHLLLTPRSLPSVESHDVIADLRGRADPDQVVLVSGHLDSWDLGTGAQDDAVGVAVAMGVAAVFRQLGLQPRRTLRVVAWMNEENGLSGALSYREAMADTLDKHVAAIESDSGAGRPLGLAAQVTAETMPLLASVFEALKPLGASILIRSRQPVAADIAPLDAAGVPGFSPLVDMRHYFDVHHSAADTLDKIDPDNLRRQVAVEAVLAWWLANADPLPRLAPTPYQGGYGD